ncbi:MAG TPA: hypothetical protein VE981_03715 [Planctomycetota bacterium]|nr:hypothetical protein [Planctomycetota bacterium]
MIRFTITAMTLIGAFSLQGQEAAPRAPALPVREITIFKDGHSLLLHEGELPVDESGAVLLDGLPQPVLGSFWPYSAEPKTPLASVVAGHRTVRVERDAATVADLLTANKGSLVTLGTNSRETVTGTLIAVNGTLAFVRTAEGLRPLLLNQIDTATFRDRNETHVAEDQDRTALTLRLDWGREPRAKTARVGMMYLQKGIRWIPSYKIDIDGKGLATVKLQATIVNELTDLDNVDAHLVVGVPSFAFKDTPDPISLQKAAAVLSRYFQPDSQTAYAMSNAVYSQSLRATEVRRGAEPAAAEPGNGDGDAKDDIYVFPVKKVSLKKGEVLVLPVTEFKVDYKDLYAVEIPLTPPRDVQAQMAGRATSDMEKIFHAPKAVHKIRLLNKTAQPITTAPALILENGRLIAQGMTSYTSSGGTSDVELTTAVDIQVKKTDNEKDRVPNALHWRSDNFHQIFLEGKLCLTNYRKAPVEVEVSRVVLGEVSAPGRGGSVEKLNLMEDSKGLDSAPYYYWFSSWWWWNHVNPVSRITWKATLEPGKSTDLEYAWSYYWRN